MSSFMPHLFYLLDYVTLTSAAIRKIEIKEIGLYPKSYKMTTKALFQLYLSLKDQIMCNYLNVIHYKGHAVYMLIFEFFLISQTQSH